MRDLEIARALMKPLGIDVTWNDYEVICIDANSNVIGIATTYGYLSRATYSDLSTSLCMLAKRC